MKRPRPHIPHVIGHRGACGHAPENTLASLRAAARRGVSWVEFDAKLTADGRVVLFHDNTLRRTTGTTGKVAAASLERLKSLDAGAWFAPEFRGERVPALAEAISVLTEEGLGAVIELKPSPGQERDTGAAVAHILKRRWPAKKPRPLISSFYETALSAAADALPGYALALNVRRVANDWRGRLDRLGCGALHCRHQYLTRARAAEVARAGYALRCFTVDDAMRARTLFRWGVEGVFSNFPERIGKPE